MITTTWHAEQNGASARLLEEVWRKCNGARTVQDALLQAEFASEKNPAHAFSVVATVTHAARPTADDYAITYTYQRGHLIATTRRNLGVPDVVLPGQLDIFGNVYQPEEVSEPESTLRPVTGCLF